MTSNKAGAGLAVTFLGAAGTVTGSQFLIEAADARILIDCGMFQGSKTLKERNYLPLSCRPKDLDAVLLTHAHIDHSGLFPKLRKEGFTGPAFCTSPTRDLLAWLLPDSGAIQEGDVMRLNRRRTRRGLEPFEPIYTAADGMEASGHLTAIDFDEWIDVAPGLRARFWHAGHILGAASIEIEWQAGAAIRRLCFSGDVGPQEKAFHRKPEGPAGLDLLVMESTYGDRDRTDLDAEGRRGVLAGEVATALKRGGNLIIPAFAVERSQELIADLIHLRRNGQIPPADIFLDSPLAVRASEVFMAHAPLLSEGGTHADLQAPFVHYVADMEDSKKLNRIRSGAIILAASGMCDAGRVRHHLANNLWRAEATILLTGFQAEGTTGRLLEEGAKTVRMEGQEVAVKAAVRKIDVYSGHADRSELLAWAAGRMPVTGAIAVVHGESDAADALAGALTGLAPPPRQILVPGLGDKLLLAADGTARHEPAPAPVLTGAPVRAKGWDSHNDYAKFLIDLRERLDQTADERGRAKILRRLKAALSDEA